jgi:hypothetical protein
MSALVFSKNRKEIPVTKEINTELLDTLVQTVAPQLNKLYRMDKRPDTAKGACVTWSKLLAKAFRDAGVAAEVRPVYILVANQVGIDFMQGKITREEATRGKGCTQMYGSVQDGQMYQHAVCYIKDWEVVIDLSMTRRGSGRVPAEPYWFGGEKEKPWWIFKFDFRDYKLKSYASENFPTETNIAQALIHAITWRYLCKKT